MPQVRQDLIEQYVSAIRNIYGTHTKQIILYGSDAQRDFHKDSDIEIFLTLSGQTYLDIQKKRTSLPPLSIHSRK